MGPHLLVDWPCATYLAYSVPHLISSRRSDPGEAARASEWVQHLARARALPSGAHVAEPGEGTSSGIVPMALDEASSRLRSEQRLALETPPFQPGFYLLPTFPPKCNK